MWGVCSVPAKCLLQEDFSVAAANAEWESSCANVQEVPIAASSLGLPATTQR